MTPSHSRIQLFSHMLFVHQSFVKQVSVLKRGRWSVETTTWKRGSPGEWSSVVRLQRGWISFLQLSVQLTCGCNQLDRLQTDGAWHRRQRKPTVTLKHGLNKTETSGCSFHPSHPHTNTKERWILHKFELRICL